MTIPTNLICLPYAGAGASIFREWKMRAPPTLRVVALQLAGREQRIREPPATSVAACVSELLPRALKEIGGQGQVALFGHSLGAVLAFELTRRLLGAGVRVRRLFVSGSPGPSASRSDRASGLSDAQFLQRVEEFAGYHHPALDDPGLRDLFLPLLRADVSMHEEYSERVPRPIDVPITAIRGADDTLVSDFDLETWRPATSSTYEAIRLAGGHMYFAGGVGEILQLVTRQLLLGWSDAA